MILYVYPIPIRNRVSYLTTETTEHGFPSINLSSTTTQLELQTFHDEVVAKLREIKTKIEEKDMKKFERISAKIIEILSKLKELYVELHHAQTAQLKTKIEQKITKYGSELAIIFQQYNITQSLRYGNDVIMAPFAEDKLKGVLISKILDYQQIQPNFFS